MELVLTVSCRLKTDCEAMAQLDMTLQTFADACNFINQNVAPDVTSAFRIQALLYREVRERFGLSANLTIRAMGRIAANRKTAKAIGRKVYMFHPTSVNYDARIFSFRERDWTVSLTLLHKRQRFQLDIGDYQRRLLQERTPTNATLSKDRKGRYYVHIQLKSPIPDSIQAEKFLGVDLGRRDIAHTSEGDSFTGKEINRLRDHCARLRATLQHKATKGTRSTRRRCRSLLQRLAGRERRFQTWLNHTISFRIVKQARRLGCIIALEDLTGIRDRTNKCRRTKVERRRSNSWAFFQLRRFLAYKAVKYGVTMLLVNPAYTSSMCHRCLRLGKRLEKQFRCGFCEFKGNADFNAAKNIALLGAVVNQPGGPGLFCSLDSSPRAAESPSQSTYALKGAVYGFDGKASIS